MRGVKHKETYITNITNVPSNASKRGLIRMCRHSSSNYLSYITAMSHGRHGVPDHRPFQCLLSHLFGLTSKKHRSSVLLVLTGPVTDIFPDKGPVTRKIFPYHYVIMKNCYLRRTIRHTHMLFVGYWKTSSISSPFVLKYQNITHMLNITNDELQRRAFTVTYSVYESDTKYKKIFRKIRDVVNRKLTKL